MENRDRHYGGVKIGNWKQYIKDADYLFSHLLFLLKIVFLCVMTYEQIFYGMF